MKKTFRKAIAVFLAVLMVAFSVPFSALASSHYAPDMFGSTDYTVTKNRKWWVDDGVDTSLSKLQSTPDFWSYGSDETWNELGSYEWAYGTGIKGFDTFVEGGPIEDHRNDYKPVVAATVSNLGNDTDALTAKSKGSDAMNEYNTKYVDTYYGASSTKTYEAVKEAGNIVNPANVKAGQRIAITVEVGGFDVINSGQFKGKFDKDYLEAGTVSNVTKRSKGWTADTSSNLEAKNGLSLYGSGVVFSSGSCNPQEGTWYGAITGQTVVNGTETATNYFGADAQGKKPFGKYGFVAYTYTFKVLKDCDLSEVFTFDRDIAGTEFEPYHRTSLDGSGDPSVKAPNPELFLITGDDTKSTFANWALIWTDYSKDSTPETKTYTITFNDINGKTVDTQTVKEGDTPTVPSTNTAATVNYKSDNKHEVTTYSWPAVSAATADATYKEVATTAEENCNITYAETSKHTIVSGTVLTGTCTVCNHVDTQTKDDKLDGTAYYAALAKAEAVKADDYTAESYAKVTAALEANAKATVEAYTDQAQVTAAATALEDAVKGLVLVKVYTITFTNAAGTVVDTQKLAAGATPVAPKANTAPTAAESDKNGKTHSHTTYSWPAVSAVTANANYDEVANVVTEDCTKGTPVVTEPTLDKPGSEVTSCTICGQVLETKVLPQLKGYDITVAKTAYGTTTLNSEDATNGKTTKVLANSTVTLTAQANKGAQFVGWKVAQKLVSTDETYSFTAVANTEVTPVFTETAESTFVVVFIDMYGNVVSTQEVTSGAKPEVPATAPIYPGYTFKGWSLTNDEIAALKEGTTIRAIYEKDATQTYTVKAAGATITVNGKDYTDKAENVAYDAKVTVTKAGATSWAVNGATVGYGESYSFFCASDIELTAVTKADDTSKTQVAIVSTTRPSATDCDVLFVATRTLADNETVFSQGFVYGKNAVASDLTLENVGKTASGTNPGKVKVAYNGIGEQFGLNYGITAMTGTAAARAFVVTQDADGNVHTYYSEASLYNY